MIMKMPRLHFIGTFLLMFSIGACSPAERLTATTGPANTLRPPQITETKLAGNLSPTDRSPLIEIQPSPFPSSTPSIQLVEPLCMQIEDELRPDTALRGSLILFSRLFKHILDLRTMNLRAFPISPDAIIRDYPPEVIAHSPDREYLAYVEIFLEDGRWKYRRLRLLDATGNRHDLSYWSVDWQWVLGWIDNNRLAIAIPGRPDGAVTVLNPFTGVWSEILPEFPPPAAASILYPRWTFPIVVFYDPSLTHVAYPIGEHGEGVVLYDLQADSIIWEGKTPDRYWVFKSHTLEWSPDGNNLAVVVQAIDGTDQLILVDPDGSSKTLLWASRITPGAFSIIENIAWSPNGKYIAGWLGTDIFGDSSLVLIDVEAETVFDLCTSTAYDSLPIWSPDGSQIAIEVREEYSRGHTLIIDLNEGYAFKVADDLAPVGWLVDGSR
jgi:hypothetical protein